MIDSCREIDFALKYVTVESFARDEECFKLPYPTRGIEFPAQQLLAPRELTTDQRYVLKELIEEEGLRG